MRLALLSLLVVGASYASEPKPVLLASADVGTSVRDWYTGKLLRQPTDPLNPTLSGLTVNGAATMQSLTLTGIAALTLNANGLTWNPTQSELALTAGNAYLYFSNVGGGTGVITANISAASAGATAASAAFKFYPQQVLDATDLVLSVGPQGNGSSLFSVAYNGNTTSSGTHTAPQFIASGANGFAGSSATALFQASAANGIAALEGNQNDAAAATGVKIGNGISLTAGVDRYIATFYNDNLATVRARVFSDGTYQNLATTGTAASGTGVTSVYNSAVRDFVHKVTITNAAMTAAATTDITIHTTPVNTRINRITADVTQVFTGGALTAVTIQCGNSAGGNQYLLANSVFTAQNTWGDVAAEIGAGLLSATVADMGTSAAGVPGAITVQCRFTCTTANCNAATQGSVTVYVEGVTY